MTDEPRIAPLPQGVARRRCGRRWPPCGRAEPPPPVPAAGPGRPKGLNVLGTLARHPDAGPGLPHLQRPHPVRHDPVAAPARAAGAAGRRPSATRTYEWSQHVVLAGDAGLTRRGGRPASPRARRAGLVGRSTGPWSAPSTSCSPTPGRPTTPGRCSPPSSRSEQLMDLVFTVGAYDLLAMAFRSFGCQLDDDLTVIRRRLAISIFSYGDR